MQRLDNWQRPATDDINPDALEYLFAQTGPQATPWVRMVNETPAEPIARITPEYIRLQTRVEVLKGIVQLTNEQLHDAHHQIGMQAAELARRDVLLNELNDYRAKAAIAIAYERHNEILRSRVQELQQAIQLIGEVAPREESATTSAVNASNYVVTNPRAVSVPTLAINTVLVLLFAVATLITILH